MSCNTVVVMNAKDDSIVLSDKDSEFLGIFAVFYFYNLFMERFSNPLFGFF